MTRMSDTKICKVCNYNEATTKVKVLDEYGNSRKASCCGQCKEWQEDLAFEDAQYDKMESWREKFWDNYFNPAGYRHHY